MFTSRTPFLLVGLVVLVCLAQPTLAFGAGNIASLSKIEGINCEFASSQTIIPQRPRLANDESHPGRHGDIEDALLNIAMAKCMNGKKFNKIMLSRIYFGNWLRDYSQAIGQC